MGFDVDFDRYDLSSLAYSVVISEIVENIKDCFNEGTTSLVLDEDKEIVEEYGIDKFTKVLEVNGFKLDIENDELVVTKVIDF